MSSSRTDFVNYYSHGKILQIDHDLSDRCSYVLFNPDTTVWNQNIFDLTVMYDKCKWYNSEMTKVDVILKFVYFEIDEDLLIIIRKQ